MINKIKEKREEKGLTQDQLAMELGVSRQTINSLEKGRYIASLQLAIKIAKFFQTSIESIFIE